MVTVTVPWRPLRATTPLETEEPTGATLSDSYAEDTAAIDEFVFDECRFRNVAVTAVDFAFEADLETVVV